MSTGILSTFAGTGSTTYNGDALLATSASLYYPHGVSVDATGNSLCFYYYTVLVCYITTYFHRQRVHLGYLQPPCPQGDSNHVLSQVSAALLLV